MKPQSLSSLGDGMTSTYIPNELLNPVHEKFENLFHEKDRPVIDKYRKFNGSICPHGGKLLFATRRIRPDVLRSDIVITELDAQMYQPVGEVQAITLPLNSSTEHFEDPRLMEMNGRLWLSVVSVPVYKATGYLSSMRLFRLGELASGRWQVEHECVMRFGGNGVEPNKNWQFFGREGRYFCIWSVNPHVVVEFDPESGQELNRWETHLPFSWPFGSMSGGTPPIPVDVGQSMLSFFHGYNVHRTRQRRYSMTPYVFENKPPFRITGIGHQPMIYGDEENPMIPLPPFNGWEPLVVFPCGLIKTSKSFVISAGVNDCINAVIEIPDETLWKSIEAVERWRKPHRYFFSDARNHVPFKDDTGDRWVPVRCGAKFYWSVLKTSDPFVMENALSTKNGRVIEITDAQYHQWLTKPPAFSPIAEEQGKTADVLKKNKPVSAPPPVNTLPDALIQRLKSIETLAGWCDQNKAIRLAQMVLDEQPSLIVEIGVYGGRSLAAMAMAAQYVLATTGRRCRVIGIDPWSVDASLEDGAGGAEHQKWWAELDHEKIYRDAVAGLNALGMDGIELWHMTDAEAVLKMEGNSIDILHTDGNHSAVVAERVARAWTPKVKPGGINVVDDLNWAAQAGAFDLLRNSLGYDSTEEVREGSCQYMICRKSPITEEG